MAVIEATSRLLPGVVGNLESLENESYSHGLLEFPQYTRPFDFQGDRVPEVLLSGNHQKIREWRDQNALKKTKQQRPDLFQRFMETEKENKKL